MTRYLFVFSHAYTISTKGCRYLKTVISKDYRRHLVRYNLAYQMNDQYIWKLDRRSIRYLDDVIVLFLRLEGRR